MHTLRSHLSFERRHSAQLMPFLFSIVATVSPLLRKMFLAQDVDAVIGAVGGSVLTTH